jgi:outer membrane protein assembly factor BamD
VANGLSQGAFELALPKRKPVLLMLAQGETLRQADSKLLSGADRGFVMNRTEFHIIAVALTVLMLAGCPALWNTTAVDKNSTPEQLYREGERHFKAKDYSGAISAFDRLKSAPPQFEKTPDAYLKTADAMLENGSYEKAVGRYKTFVELYPLHKEVPRAKYQVALSYFNQIKNADLDNSIIQAALQAFKALSEDPKAGEWAKKAEKKLRECRKKLAEKEIYKAQTYLGMGRYKSAQVSAKRVLDEYAKLGYDAEARALLNKVKDK